MTCSCSIETASGVPFASQECTWPVVSGAKSRASGAAVPCRVKVTWRSPENWYRWFLRDAET